MMKTDDRFHHVFLYIGFIGGRASRSYGELHNRIYAKKNR